MALQWAYNALRLAYSAKTLCLAQMSPKRGWLKGDPEVPYSLAGVKPAVTAGSLAVTACRAAGTVAMVLRDYDTGAPAAITGDALHSS